MEEINVGHGAKGGGGGGGGKTQKWKGGEVSGLLKNPEKCMYMCVPERVLFTVRAVGKFL